MFFIVFVLTSCNTKDDKSKIEESENKNSVKTNSEQNENILKPSVTKTDTTVIVSKQKQKNIDQNTQEWFTSNHYIVLDEGLIPIEASKLLKDLSKRARISKPNQVYLTRAKKTISIKADNSNYFPVITIEKWEFKNRVETEQVYSLLNEMRLRPFIKKTPKAFFIDNDTIYN